MGLYIKKINLENFGKFDHLDLNLGQGFNLFYGPNEAGKSTIMDGIFLAFYGQLNRSRKVHKNVRLRYIDGQGDPARVLVLFEEGGRTYRLGREFGSSLGQDRVEVRDDRTGEEVILPSDQSPGEYFFKLSAESFVRSAFVFSQDMGLTHSPGHAGELKDRLANIQGSGSEFVSYSSWKENLEGRLKAYSRNYGKSGLLPEKEEEIRKVQVNLDQAIQEEEEKARLEKKIHDLEEEVALLTQAKEDLGQVRDLIGQKDRAESDLDLKIHNQNLYESYARALEDQENLKEEIRQLETVLDQESQELEAARESDREEKESRDRVKKSLNSRFGLGMVFTFSSLFILFYDLHIYLSQGRMVFWPLLLAALIFILGWILAARSKAELLARFPEGEEAEEAWRTREVRDQMVKNQADLDHARQDLSRRLEEKAGWGRRLDTAGLPVPPDKAGARECLAQAAKDRVSSQEDLDNLFDKLEKCLADFQLPAWLGLEGLDQELDPNDPDQLAQILAWEAESQDRIQEKKDQVLTIRTGVQERYANHEGPETLRARIRQMEAEKEDLVLDYRAIQTSLDLLNGAYRQVQKSFSPRLNARAGEILQAFLGQAYDRIRVASDFALSLESPNRDLVEGAYLSTGTWDQAYLALRIALVDLLDPAGTIPLFLDDVLVYADDQRARRGMDFLQAYGQSHRQVLFFTAQKKYLTKVGESQTIKLVDLTRQKDGQEGGLA